MKDLQPLRVLSVAPRSRSLGFAVLEGAHRLIDWGTRSTREQKGMTAMAATAALLAKVEPDLLVVESTDQRDSRRAPRIRALIRDLRWVARSAGVGTKAVPMLRVRALFGGLGASTRRDFAVVIVRRFPELEPHLPPRRLPWMSEDERLAIFDAVAFALAFYRSSEEEARRAS